MARPFFANVGWKIAKDHASWPSTFEELDKKYTIAGYVMTKKLLSPLLNKSINRDHILTNIFIYLGAY
jgi:hypothetical protein